MKKKPFIVKLLIWLLLIILSIIIPIGFACVRVYKKHNVNVFKVIGQVKTLNEEVDLNRIVSNAFSEQDLAKAKLMTDTNLSGLITYSEQNGYKVNFENVQNMMSGDLRFTDREVGAIINTIMKNNPEIKIDSNSEEWNKMIDIFKWHAEHMNIKITHITLLI